MINGVSLQPYLPQEWLRALKALPPHVQKEVQEIRLRAEEPIRLSLACGERFLSAGGLTALRQPGLFFCSGAQLQQCFLRFCEESVYAHEEELQQGFLAVEGGIRVGVAGTAVVEQGTVRVVTGITSLCIRLPRRHRGCATPLMPFMLTSSGVASCLLVGEPSSGKTSLLRDIAAQLAARGLRVTVVDERGEIAGVDGLRGCDVLRGCPKATGVRQAVRCLAPQVVIFDELGDEQEVQAVAACSHNGVAVIASLHGSHPQELAHRPVVHRLLKQRVFQRWMFLEGRRRPGRVAACYESEVMGDEVDWRVVGGTGGDGPGVVLLAPFVSAG